LGKHSAKEGYSVNSSHANDLYDRDDEGDLLETFKTYRVCYTHWDADQSPTVIVKLESDFS